MRKAFPLILFFILAIAFAFIVARAWQNKPKEQHIILISKGIGSEAYERYGAWLSEFNHGIQCINVYRLPADSINKLIPLAYGLLLSGGPDVHPGRYDRIDDTSVCGIIDLYRDSLEFALIYHAMQRKMPVLGICRGLQILNVNFGGSLYADIPTQFAAPGIWHRCEDPDTCRHEVRIEASTFLASVVEKESGTVNSNHHQGIRDMAPVFKAGAFGTDGLPEAIEWQDPEGRGFLLAVQWHPERLEKDNPMSFPIARRFIGETYAYKLYLKREAKKK